MTSPNESSAYQRSVERLALVIIGYPVSSRQDQRHATKLEANASGMMSVLRRERPEFAAVSEADARALAVSILAEFGLVAIDPALVEDYRRELPAANMGDVTQLRRTAILIADAVLAQLGGAR